MPYFLFASLGPSEGLFLSCVLPKSREFTCVVIGSQKMVVLVRNPLSSELQFVTLPAEGWSVGDFLRSWCQAQVNECSYERSGWRRLLLYKKCVSGFL